MIDPRRLKPGDRFQDTRGGVYTVVRMDEGAAYVLNACGIEVLFGFGVKPLEIWPWNVATIVRDSWVVTVAGMCNDVTDDTMTNAIP